MTSHRHDSVVRLLDRRQPACGTTKVLAIDGPSGSGKSTIAADLTSVTGGLLLQLDDVYPGWHGLEATPPLIARALGSIAAGEIGTVDRWDWASHRVGGSLRLPPTRLLILDGVGSGAAVIRPYLSVLVWAEAPTDVRRARALARDGGAYAPFWEVWAAQEDRHFAAEQTRRHADVVMQTGA